MNAWDRGEPSRYRYELRRRINLAGFGEIVWVMLNPSTATEVKDDPTIRRVIDFSKRWNFESLRVVNLVPLRSTDPRKAIQAYQCPPYGADFFTNGDIVRRSCEDADAVILAWGTHGQRLLGDDTRESIECITEEAWCLGWTANGQPRHPLYVPATTRPVHIDDNSRRWLRGF